MIKKDNPPEVKTNFPITDEHHDCAGIKRLFKIDAQHLPNGWFLSAIEQQVGEHGYQFNTFSVMCNRSKK